MPWRKPKPAGSALLRSLLYGRGVDRNVKARARLGLAVLAFAGIYGVIALRLAMFAAAGNDHADRHTVSQDALATARPDILDRNGAILATDVKAPSLFAEPRKLIDVDEAVELLTAVLPDLDAKELRERLSSKRGFVWLKREITPQQQQEIHHLGIPGIGFLTENKRVYPNGADRLARDRPRQHRQPGHRRHREVARRAGAWRRCTWRGSPPTVCRSRSRSSLDLRVQFALRDELIKAREKFKAKAAAGVILDVNTGEVVALVSEPDFDPNNPREAQRSRRASTA